jgi:hypothetical protein
MQACSGSPGPTEADLAATLGGASESMSAIRGAMAAAHAPLAVVWKPSKSEFGRFCRLRRKDRTLVYLTPEKGRILAAVVLGEKALAAALASDVPKAIKTSIAEARPYADGRGIRLPASTQRDVQVVADLVALKLAAPARAKRG